MHNDILQQIDFTRYPKKAELPDIEAACHQRLEFLERKQLTLPALKQNAAFHCRAHGELAILYFFKARILWQTRASKAIARSLLEATVPNELAAILTIAEVSLPDIPPLEDDPYHNFHLANRQLLAQDWKVSLQVHFQQGAWDLAFITAHDWTGQRCRELSWGFRIAAQKQMPNIAEKIIIGEDYPFLP